MRAPSPNVSVMMPAYNAEAYIGRAIESVIAQSYEEWELVIVDDGSTDHTSEIINRYTDPRIRVFHQENRGEAAARNFALSNLRGDFVAFLDADDLFLETHLEKTVGVLSENYRVGGVYTDGFYVDQDENRLQTLSSRRRFPFEGNIFEEVVYSSDVLSPPVSVVLRTGIIKNYNLRFDESIVIGPDWDFFVKYSESANFQYINSHTCLYRLHTDNISVRTGLEKRARELAKCRINAIRMTGFGRCSLKVRYWVLYDLLINLLLDDPELQSDITEWPAFKELPRDKRAKLFRLMASKTLVYGENSSEVGNWLKTSYKLDPSSRTTFLLRTFYKINPNLLAGILKVKNFRKPDLRSVDPFSDINSTNKRS